MFGSEKLSPEFFTSLGAGLLSGNTWNEQLANGATGVNTALTAAKTKAEADALKNRTVQMLQTQSPELANAVAGGLMTPNDAFVSYLKQKQEMAEAAKPKWTVQNINGRLVRVDPTTGQLQELGNFQEKKPNIINTGKGLLYNQDTGEWIKPPLDVSQGQTEYNKTPIYGMDENGNTVLLQTSDQATAAQTKLPPGVTLGKDPIKIDTPTAVILLDPVTRQTIQTIPKDIAGAEQQKVQGKLTGEQIQQLPQTLAKADQAIEVIDKALSHPGREKTTGLNSVFDPRTYIPGTDSADFQALAGQLEGKAFLEAFESLKGGGQITEVEGQKATQAIARLSMSQSDEAYKQALLDLREIIEAGRRRAEQMASRSSVSSDARQDTMPGVNTTSTGVKWKVPGQ